MILSEINFNFKLETGLFIILNYVDTLSCALLKAPKRISLIVYFLSRAEYPGQFHIRFNEPV